MQGLIKGIWTGFLSITGVGKFLSLWDKEPFLCVFLLVCLALSMVWMIRLFPKPTASVSKTIGGFAIGFLKIAIGFGIAMGLANMLVSMGLGLITGAVRGIPIIGDGLASMAEYVIQMFMSFVMAIAIGWYILKNINSLFGKAEGILTGAMGDWKADEKDGGLNGVKWLYVIATTLIFGVMICHPNWNASMYYIPAGLSGATGIFALVYTTIYGKKMIERGKAKVKGAPRESDGAWKCPNEGVIPLLDNNLKPILNAKGNKKGKQGRCEGPTGLDPQGIPYDGWNPKEARQCLSLLCDHPNPYWQICEACKFAGDDKKGFPRKPNVPCVCPKCKHFHPALPEKKKFHLPGKDKSNPAQAKAAAKAQPQAAPAPKQDNAAPPRGSLCPSCKGDMGFVLDEKHCPYCGASLTGEVSPSGPMAAQPEPEEEEGVVKKDYDVLDDKS